MTPFACAVTPSAHEPEQGRGIEQGQQEGVDERDHQEQFEAILPEPKARGFKRQFGYGKTKGDFDLPAAGLSQDDAPRVVVGKDGFIGP